MSFFGLYFILFLSLPLSKRYLPVIQKKSGVFVSPIRIRRKYSKCLSLAVIAVCVSGYEFVN